MHLFFQGNINLATICLTNNRIIDVSKDESGHIAKTLRLKVDDIIYITDGKGKRAKCKLISLESNICKVLIEEIETVDENNFYLHIAVAPTKNIARFEWFVEKATEIGISEITPIICDHSERKIIKKERIEKIAISAMKQSLKCYLPKINESIKFNDFLKLSKNSKGLKFIGWVDEKKQQQHLKQLCNQATNAIITIGPEGDFSKIEIDNAIACNFQPISLGKSRLRTETAALTACVIFNIINS